MIQQLNDLPANMVGFKATGEVTQDDFTKTVMPSVKELIDRTGKLNYMLVLDTSIKEFTFGAWVEDAMMGMKHLIKWNRAAIISDSKGIQKFTDVFSVLMPGEFKGFTQEELQKAIDWVSGKED